MTLKIKRFLAATYPEHSELFLSLKAVPKLKPRPMPLPEAVVRVITGQMLSGKAAMTIYNRVAAARDKRKLAGSWLLDQQSLRACGLSTAKSQAIVRFGCRVGKTACSLDHWRDLCIDDLFLEIKHIKGLGDWSAGIIALFYVGHEDVFPKGDGSLQRAIKLLSLRKGGLPRSYRFNPEIAQPFRSYLALYLWQALDTGKLA